MPEFLSALLLMFSYKGLCEKAVAFSERPDGQSLSWIIYFSLTIFITGGCWLMIGLELWLRKHPTAFPFEVKVPDVFALGKAIAVVVPLCVSVIFIVFMVLNPEPQMESLTVLNWILVLGFYFTLIGGGAIALGLMTYGWNGEPGEKKNV
ncbi:MAG TPA: hypothetical protein VN420_01155 [Candidatus Fimivivens sp.]|nr:hypothetical protein [Candidatus Fimivivens sp.]